MVIQLDRCYKINFKTKEEGGGANFSLLDGFYEVVRSYGWNELMGAGIDLQKNLLDHAGIVDTTALRTLQTNWINDAFYLCIGMDQDRQIWVPESIIKGYPEPRIGSYKKLGLVLDLGVFANKSDFETLGKEVMDYLRANYGIDRPDATLMVYGNEWMTVEEYENTDLQRKHIQGKAFTHHKLKVRPSTDLTVTEVEFGTPVILAREGEQIQPGAFSNSINVVYGIDLKGIPEGSETSDEPCWFYTSTDIDNEATTIERESEANLTAKILKSINLMTKFVSPSYKWVSTRGNTLYTNTLAPTTASNIFSSELCDNNSKIENRVIGNVTAKTETSEATIVVDNIDTNGEIVNDTTEVFTFDIGSNYVEVDISYRCRNTGISATSPYSLALKYAYENKELRRRVVALQQKLIQR